MAANGSKLKKGQVRVNGKVYSLKQNLTLLDAADVEEVTGVPYGTAQGVRALITMIWIAMREEDPSVTLDDVEALDFKQLEFPEDDAGPPARTPARRRASTKKRSSSRG
jgi:hypothetical protein